MRLANQEIERSGSNLSFMRDINKMISAQKRDLDTSFDGTAEIRNGELIINPPQGFGKFPIIMAGENVEIFFNGQKVDHPIIANDMAHMCISMQDTKPRTNLKIDLLNDNLTANLTIERIPGKKYALMDCQPVNQLKITGMCIQEEEPDPIEFNAVINLLHEQGVIFGIDEETIQCALSNKERKMAIEAARGVAPGESQDATIQYNLDKENNLELTKNPYGDGKIYSVSTGAILAIKIKPVMGKPGVDVKGQPIPAGKPKDAEILIKDGVKLINSGAAAVATRAGRPVLEGYQNKYISVHPVHIVEGNVDIRVGNIDFAGDIVITGSVLDGFSVKAGGSIQVKGDVMHAFLSAHGSISVHKKVLSSRLQAGFSTLAYKMIYKVLQKISIRLENMIAAIKLIKIQPAFTTTDLHQKGDGQLIQLLIDFNFKDLPKLVQNLIQIILNEKEEKFLPFIIETAQQLGKNLCNLGPIKIMKDSEISDLRNKVVSAIEKIDLMISDSADITLSYAQNSDIKASGNITITGQGAIISRLEAGRKISIEQGVVRGGELIAREAIKVSEIGSTQDAEVKVNLMESCSFAAGTVRPSIRIIHGSQMEIIQEMGYNLKVQIDNNRLSVINLSLS